MSTAIAAHSCAYQSDVFVDSHNIDGVLGTILGKRPNSWERPRWDRVKGFFPAVRKPHFVLDQRHFHDKVYGLYRKLREIGYQVDVVSKIGTVPGNEDPVDTFILEALDSILASLQDGGTHDLAVVSHDHCYAGALSAICQAGGKVSVVGFREEMPLEVLQLAERGVAILDLEHDIGAFQQKLPRPELPIYQCADQSTR